MKWMPAAVGQGLLYIALLSTVCAGPLPSAKPITLKAPERLYFPDTEEQSTEWTSSNINVDGGPFLETNKTITEILLNIDQSTGLRQTRQVIDQPTALPEMEQPYLFFAMRQFLVKIYPDGSGAQAWRLTGGANAISCDFDARDRVLFWSDVNLGAIYAVFENGSSPILVVNITGGVADGIAWDWINKKLYWTDARHKTVEVIDPINGDRKLLFRTGSTSNPRAIVLDPTTKQMYLTDWGVNPSIQRASMDGTSLVNLHTTELVWPNALTIDHSSQTLYWADASLDKIETSNTDGLGRRVLITQYVFHPFGITFFEGALFWSDWQARAIITAPVTTPRNFGAVISNLILDPMGIHMVSVERQPSVSNPCEDNNGGCSHLCLLSNTSSECFTCCCPDGMYISTDRRNCLPGVPRPAPPATPQVCIPECHNNGLCISTGICRCMAGWTGARCDEPICTPGCQNEGTCVEPGLCSCTEDWEGPTCEQAVCDDDYCLNGGECVGQNVCSCTNTDGWTGTRCERPVCDSRCNDNGMCTAPNTCTCNVGWTGDLCDQPICNPECVNGACIAPDVCACDAGWRGPLCRTSICIQPCRNGGRCVAPNTCDCGPHYTGPTCQQALCFPPTGCLNGGTCISPSLCLCPRNFDGNQCEQAECGRCVNGYCNDENRCSCNLGWEGSDCNQAICRPNGCRNGGFCGHPGECICTSDFTGRRCELPRCILGCTHGICYRNGEHNECLCDIGWEGLRCQQALCHPPCINGGTCIRPGHCACPLGIEGSRCEDTKS